VSRLVAALAAVAILVVGCEVFPVASPPLTTECRAVPDDICAAAMREAGATALRQFGQPAVSIRIRCVAPACTAASGEIEAEAVLADGRTVSLGGSGWASPADGDGMVEVTPEARPSQ
jgi:hypothetical protein